MSGGGNNVVNKVFYATSYHPIQAGSIDGTDVAPHDNGVRRALLCYNAGLCKLSLSLSIALSKFITLFLNIQSSSVCICSGYFERWSLWRFESCRRSLLYLIRGSNLSSYYRGYSSWGKEFVLCSCCVFSTFDWACCLQAMSKHGKVKSLRLVRHIGNVWFFLPRYCL